MMNGMNGDGYTFERPTVTNAIEALTCYGCGMEQVQAMLRTIASEAQSFTEFDFGLDKATTDRLFDLWMLIEAARAREETLDALFHAAESHILKHGHQPTSAATLATVTVTGAGTISAAVGVDRWHFALAQYRAATALVEEEPADSPEQAVAVEAASAALQDLLHHRAPDHAALLAKLRIIDQEGQHNETLAWRSIIGDVEVLGGGIES